MTSKFGHLTNATISGAETLSNKTLSFADNTLEGVASLDTTQTLTNKTIAFTANTLTDVASLATAQTLTNKTIVFANNTLTNVMGTAGGQFTGGIGINVASVGTRALNVLGNTIILDACVKNNVKRYLFASSIYVFSQAGSFYRASKQCCELIIKEYQRRYKLPFTVLRFGSVYGPNASNGNAIYDLLIMANKNKTIEYVSVLSVR